MRQLICIMLGICPLLLRAQHLPDPLLSAAAGVGGYRKTNTDVFAVLSNPAAVAQATHFSAGMYGERKFLLKGLQQFCGLVQFPLRSAGVGIQLDYAGSYLMNETAVGMLYGKRLGTKLDLGLRFRYYHLNVPGHVQASALWAEAGCLFRLSEKVQSGFSFSRSTNPAIAAKEPHITQTYRMGIGYEASSRLFISADWMKQTNLDLQGNIIVLYAFEEGMRLRMGWQTLTSQPIIGAGLYWQHIWTDILMSYHPYLGFTPALQMMYAPWEKRKTKS